MSDTNTKLHDDLMGLREAAALVLAILQDEAWWERTRLLLAQYPQRGAYELVNSQEFADALNALFVTLHPDSDNDEMQERVYAALATAPEQEKLISIIMQETDVCLFGGGAMRDGLPRRNSCRFGHPGCACADWIGARLAAG